MVGKMGYESRLYVCENYRHLVETPAYVSAVAMFDLCKMGYEGPFAQLLRRHPAPAEPLFYFYDTDGNTAIKEDSYGDNLQPLPLVEVVEAIQAEIRDDERSGEGAYRRLMPCYALLAAFHHNQSQWPDVVVLHYGH